MTQGDAPVLPGDQVPADARPDARPDARSLHLPPDARSPAAARRLLHRVAAGAVPTAVLDDAEVCLSELVTNALLHARTVATVTVERTGEVLRLLVRDDSPVPPQRVPRSLTAGTGRGLALVSALSTAHGVRPEPGGKTTWCEFALTGGGADADPAEEWADVIAELGGEAGVDPPGGAGPAPASPLRPALAEQVASAGADAGPGGPIVLLGYPVRLGVRAREQREAVLRELTLMTLAGTVAPALRDRVEELAQLLDLFYGGHLAESEVRTLRAARAGVEHADFAFPRLPDHHALVRRWSRAMADLDELSRVDGQSSLAIPPDVAALDAWIVAEFTRQLDGGEPRRWPAGGA